MFLEKYAREPGPLGPQRGFTLIGRGTGGRAKGARRHGLTTRRSEREARGRLPNVRGSWVFPEHKTCRQPIKMGPDVEKYFDRALG